MSYLETAVEIAREAGALLHTHFERRVAFELKGEADLVTVADRASEKVVVERLRSLYPSHAIVAEEGTGHETDSEYRWYIDPLDGTTNFAHGVPLFAVSIGLERAGEGVVGVVYNPVTGEMYAAEKGSGAFLNGKRIHVSAARTLQESLSVTGFPSLRRKNDINIHFYYQLAMASHGTRRTGTAAQDLAWVAAGRFDLFWEFGLRPWDMAAGTVLVKEAGGRVSDMDGAPHSVNTSKHLLADNGLLHEESLAYIADIFKGKLRYTMPVIG
jgi:myo-inositol-1(or 4)-monophosphatase